MFVLSGRQPVKVRSQHREELSLLQAPRSLFDRPSPAMLKVRHDLRLHRTRGSRPPITLALPPPPLVARPPPSESDQIPEWMAHEDWAILQVSVATFIILFLKLNFIKKILTSL